MDPPVPAAAPLVPAADPPAPPKPPKVILPDFGALIERLTAEVDALKAEREGWKVRALAVDKEIAELKLKAGPPARAELDNIFHPWDLFFS